jgi:hypothetical protein
MRGQTEINGSGGASLSNKSEILLRVLAVICWMVSAHGLMSNYAEWVSFSYPHKYLLSRHPELTGTVHTMAAFDVIFVIMLIVSGILLWRLKKMGLAALAVTLCSELVYVIAIFGGAAHFSSTSNFSSKTVGALASAASVANGGLLFQIFTAFPIIAAVLIFLAYRSLRERPHA